MLMAELEKFYTKEEGRHRYKGSLKRHVIIERLLYFLQKIFVRIFGLPLCGTSVAWLYLPLDIAFGLNCGFPPRHVVLYLKWRVFDDQ